MVLIAVILILAVVLLGLAKLVLSALRDISPTVALEFGFLDESLHAE